MKLNTHQYNVQKSPGFVEHKLSIEASAHAFDILTSKIYTNVVLAIVRELSTNAYDAHVEAGKADIPFLVTLPTYLSPQFRIRDYGTGISPDDIENVYTVFFKSTRNESNDVVGCLGLGSKSPFAYTDQFSVISVFQGKRHEYAAFKNEQGIPCVTLVSTKDTKDPSGLEVIVNTKVEDDYNFEKAAKYIYHYFKIKPTIIGKKIDFIDGEPLMVGANYRIVRRDDCISYNNVVIMGQIPYKLNTIHSLLSALQSNVSIEINISIGDCSIAASREELHYDNKTSQFLGEILNNIDQDIKNAIANEIDSYNTLIEKYVFASLSKQLFSRYSNYVPPVEGVGGEEENVYSLKRLAYFNRRKSLTIQPYFDVRAISITSGKVPFLIENDVEELSHKHRRNIKYFVEHSMNECYLVLIQDREEFLTYFPESAIVGKISTLPSAPRANRTGFSGKKCYIKYMGFNYNNNPYLWRDDTKIDDNSCIVLREGNSVYRSLEDLSVGIRCNSAAMTIAKALNVDKVYGITPKSWKKYQHLPQLFDLADTFFDNEIVKLNKYELAAMQYYDELPYGITHQQDELLIQTKSSILLDAIEVNKIDRPHRRDLALIAKERNKQLPQAKNYVEIFRNAYPLISHCDSYVDIKDLVEYMCLKDMALNYA